ncbi:hypothetical protein CMO90_01965 [Candidatus Woesearchaeota archaeon]|jgi:hypothetical protein|nr:hypothetical protein [Candidatus Woesearchaeota archaeon]|tara:strand:- start:146 stop:442 length:297 start_codon:yes stop_codon:yes gene_type:complete
MLIVKEHIFEQTKTILAIVDEELLGKKIVEGNKILDLKSQFYKGKKMNELAILDKIRFSAQINAVGKKTISLLRKNKFIETTKTIGSVPYAQIILIRD